MLKIKLFSENIKIKFKKKKKKGGGYVDEI